MISYAIEVFGSGSYNPDMNLVEMKRDRGANLQVATWCFLLRNDEEVLLAMKKRGFGVGLWNASGGKVNKGETPSAAAAREALEELGVVVSNLLHVASIEFYFAENPGWEQRVEGFVTREWRGDPEETEEMAPKWFGYKEIPYDQMWADDRIWLPMVLDGKKVEGEFLFGGQQQILEYNIREMSKAAPEPKLI